MDKIKITDIQEAREAKVILEVKISNLLSEFCDQTSLYIDDISLVTMESYDGSHIANIRISTKM
jgi:hypothetical protein